MNIYLLRHGRTIWNDELRYQGRSDIPLSEEGKSEIIPSTFTPSKVYISPLCRTRQTAQLIFPNAKQEIIPDLVEMNFGIFEGRTAEEMEDDVLYREWIESYCRSRCPAGEDYTSFCNRVCNAFNSITNKLTTNNPCTIAIVAHAGTQMAIMAHYALPEKDYFSWLSPVGGGFVLEYNSKLWDKRKKLNYIKTVKYTR